MIRTPRRRFKPRRPTPPEYTALFGTPALTKRSQRERVPCPHDEPEAHALWVSRTVARLFPEAKARDRFNDFPLYCEAHAAVSEIAPRLPIGVAEGTRDALDSYLAEVYRKGGQG